MFVRGLGSLSERGGKSEAFGSTWGMWLPKASVLLFDEWGKFFSRLGEVTSHSSEVTSHSSEAMPRLSEDVSHSSEVTSHSPEATPRLSEDVARLSEVIEVDLRGFYAQVIQHMHCGTGHRTGAAHIVLNIFGGFVIF